MASASVSSPPRRTSKVESLITALKDLKSEELSPDLVERLQGYEDRDKVREETTESLRQRMSLNNGNSRPVYVPTQPAALRPVSAADKTRALTPLPSPPKINPDAEPAVRLSIAQQVSPAAARERRPSSRLLPHLNPNSGSPRSPSPDRWPATQEAQLQQAPPPQQQALQQQQHQEQPQPTPLIDTAAAAAAAARRRSSSSARCPSARRCSRSLSPTNLASVTSVPPLSARRESSSAAKGDGARSSAAAAAAAAQQQGQRPSLDRQSSRPRRLSLDEVAEKCRETNSMCRANMLAMMAASAAPSAEAAAAPQQQQPEGSTGGEGGGVAEPTCLAPETAPAVEAGPDAGA
ncbi:hypothetical protein JKP88DRAFT_246513 [Tribonema minus]|uniref:Uncharacterized protein n=1 Tax=Tribonema minus TaxID=303371 RepID=A0A835YSS3_9STRA|nr:hypothetical protein JKP88DRAFT_246513 [Tribonema minus]